MITEDYIICDCCGYKYEIEDNFECYQDVMNYFNENGWMSIKEWLNKESNVLDFCKNCVNEK